MLQARAAVERAAVQARNELLGTHDPATAKRRAKQSEANTAHCGGAIIFSRVPMLIVLCVLSACVRFRLSGESASDKNAAFSASLLRTRSMLSDEINRSSSALSTLQASTRVLGSTSSEYTTYGGTVAVGRKMITKQLQRERTDRLLLMVGLLFFSLVVIYIVHRRLAPFLFWWTTFFVNKNAQQQQQPQQPVVTTLPTMPATQIPPGTQQYFNPSSSSGLPVHVDPVAASAAVPPPSSQPPLQVHPAYSDQRAGSAAPIPAVVPPAATAPTGQPHAQHGGAPSMPDPAVLAQMAAASAAANAAHAAYAPPHTHTHPTAGPHAHAHAAHHHHAHAMPDPTMYAPTYPPPPPHAHAHPAHAQAHAGPYGP